MALRLAADFGSRFSAPETARERVREVLRRGFLPADRILVRPGFDADCGRCWRCVSDI